MDIFLFIIGSFGEWRHVLPQVYLDFHYIFIILKYVNIVLFFE